MTRPRLVRGDDRILVVGRHLGQSPSAPGSQRLGLSDDQAPSISRSLDDISRQDMHEALSFAETTQYLNSLSIGVLRKVPLRTSYGEKAPFAGHARQTQLPYPTPG